LSAAAVKERDLEDERRDQQAASIELGELANGSTTADPSFWPSQNKCCLMF